MFVKSSVGEHFDQIFDLRKFNGSGLPEFSDYFIPLQGPAKHTGALGIVAMVTFND